MNEERHAMEGDFYRACAEILGIDHGYVPWTGRPPNRWNNRRPGNGRFPGFGTIRMHGPGSIHVCLRHPVLVSRSFGSPDAALEFLSALMPRS